MTTARLRVCTLALGLLFAGQAAAATLTVYSKMTGAGGSGAVARVAPTAASAGATTIHCATNAIANCVDAAVADGATIHLEPTLVTNAAFVGWTGCTSVAGSVCTVSMTGNRTVTATFRPFTYALQVKTYPVPAGTFVPLYGGRLQATVENTRNQGEALVPVPIDCQTGNAAYTVCSGAVPNGAALVLTAVPGAGSRVTSWSGCTTSTATTCTVNPMINPRLVSATFGPSDIPVTAQVSGSGTITATAGGTVVDGMSCPGDCSAMVQAGGSITLTAAPAASATFIGWTGACTGVSPTCTIAAVTTAKAVTATFKSGTCLSCHGTPARHVSAAMNCGTCHTGYTARTVPAGVHMDGSVTTTDCSACHAGASSHGLAVTGANRSACGSCHNYDSHIDSSVQVAITNPAVPRPVADIAFAITSATVTSGSAPVVEFSVTDPANGNAPLTIGAGGVGNPSFTLSKLQADGTYLSYVVRGRDGLPYTKPDGTPGVVAITDGNTSSTCTIGGATPCATQANSDTFSASRLVSLGGGNYRYTFASPVTVTDPAQLHTVAMWGTRTVSGYAFRAHAHRDFAPDRSAVTSRQVVSDAACNACHGQLQVHGSRRGVKVCLTCHSPQTVDPESGNHVDMATMVHKIHQGEHLANPYFVVGFGQAYFTTAHILMAPSHSGFFEGGGTYLAAQDPGIQRECGLCHQGTQANNAYTKASRRACGSCHDEVNFATGAGHASIPGSFTQDDTLCSGCHPSGAVAMYHSRFYEPTFNVNFNTLSPPVPPTGHDFRATLVSVAGGATSLTWTVDFRLDGAATGPSSLSSGSYRWATCAFQLAGPTTDYTFPATGGTAQSCTAVATWTATGTPGRFTFTATPTPPAVTFFSGKPAGYYTGSFEIMFQRVFGDGTNFVRKPFSANPNFLTLHWDGTAVRVVTGVEQGLNARRGVVEFDKCNACHVDIGFHSNRGRKGPDYCATCHNPKLDNGTRARATVANAYTTPLTGTSLVYLPESVSMNVFIHRIHMGSQLPSVRGLEIGSTVAATASPWVPEPGRIVYGATRSNFIGFTATTPPEFADLTEFTMPNDMRRCEQCHIDAGSRQTWALPERSGLAPVERTFRRCTPNATRPVWATEDWCESQSSGNAGMVSTGVKVVTPPLKASCTSCHDSLATDAHADLYTTSPMTAGAVEYCAGCHGAGKEFDALRSHRPLP